MLSGAEDEGEVGMGRVYVFGGGRASAHVNFEAGWGLVRAANSRQPLSTRSPALLYKSAYWGMMPLRKS